MLLLFRVRKAHSKLSKIYMNYKLYSTFTGGRNGVEIDTTGTILRAIFGSTTFSLNRIGSVITPGSVEESILDIQNVYPFTFFVRIQHVYEVYTHGKI